MHRGHRKVIEPIFAAALEARGPNTSVLLQALPIPLADSAIAVSPDGWSDAATGRSAESLAAMPLKACGYTTVVTFSPHPQEFFSGQPRPMLTPLDEKVECLRQLGVEQLVLLPFDRQLASLTPTEFVEKILVQHLQARQVSVGQDFCFGQRRSGTTADLQAIAQQYGITVNVVPLFTSQGERISSSAIRQALSQGDVVRANQLLGRLYTLTGTVEQGQQLGRTIGFPTANLSLPPDKFLPCHGVYAVRVTDNSSSSTHAPLLGVMNIGNRPTVGGARQTVEVYLLDWIGDLYGKTLTVQLESFLRAEQKFDTLEALKTQIQTDCTAARRLLTSGHPA